MEFNRSEFKKLLEEKGALNPCGRCGHGRFSIINGFTNLNLSENMGENIFGGMTIPTIQVACDNCGAITQHAVGALKSIK